MAFKNVKVNWHKPRILKKLYFVINSELGLKNIPSPAKFFLEKTHNIPHSLQYKETDLRIILV